MTKIEYLYKVNILKKKMKRFLSVTTVLIFCSCGPEDQVIDNYSNQLSTHQIALVYESGEIHNEFMRQVLGSLNPNARLFMTNAELEVHIENQAIEFMAMKFNVNQELL